MNKILSLLPVAGKAWGWLNGKKTALGAIAGMCSGAGMLLAGVAGLVLELRGLQGSEQLVAFVRAIAADPNIHMIGAGGATFSAGLSVLGVGHKLEKQTQALTGGAVSVAPSQEGPQS